MARLRFPGRPGYRFGRLGVKYGFDVPKQGSDPSTILIANIHRGLRYFYELFGESDEVKHSSFLHYKFLLSKLHDMNEVEYDRINGFR